MNKRDWIVLAVLVSFGYTSHRDIVQRTGYSIGLVNTSLKRLAEEGYLGSEYELTDKAFAHMDASRPRRAVILAAGMGLRMTPINGTPKGLLQINGEVLIERLIRQLGDAGITDISLVVGYRQESFEYLTDMFDITLITNREFAQKDSLHSLALVADRLENCYIVPSNVWFSRNPFSVNEFFSWYAVTEYIDDDSYIRFNRKMELVYTGEETSGNAMVGLCYLCGASAESVRQQLGQFDTQRKMQHESWERALFVTNKMNAYARIMLGQTAFKITTYEDLREIDSESKNLRSKRLRYISQAMKVAEEDITDIFPQSGGMTNRHIRFSVDGAPYLLRVPGEGSNEIIDRHQEAAVYKALEGHDLSDIVVAISPEDGYKINAYRLIARECDPNSEDDVRRSILHLKRLHDMKLETECSFDILERLEWFERLRGGEPSFSDYDETRAKVIELLELSKKLPEERCLCHNDVADVNFLFYKDSEDGEESVSLIDWEYGGMNDPHFDISIFCIFADYTKEQIDSTARIYFGGDVPPVSLLKIYIYAASAGLLWSVWSEYKRNMGVDFGDYTMKQYRYAKRFYTHAMELAEELKVR